MISLRKIKFKPIGAILLLGLILRLVFVVFIAKYYFGRADIFIDGDTPTWFESIKNLITTGVYTYDPASDCGLFTRMPGYPFFIGIFYLITGGNTDLLYPMIGYAQILIDVVAIYFIYRLALNLFNSNNLALILALMYAGYPFIIVWNPVVYTESVSTFFLIMCFYFLSGNKKHRWFLSGIFLGIAILMRPQIILLTAIIGAGLILLYWYQPKLWLKYGIQFTLAIMLTYGLWPLRNYVFYNKVAFTEEQCAWRHYGPDFFAFTRYLYVVKSGAYPQFMEILQNKPFTYPEASLSIPEDTAKLNRAIFLCKTCGSSFSAYPEYWKKEVKPGEDCNAEIVKLFDELRINQQKKNFWNVYLWVPLQNMNKALFKSSLQDTTSIVRKLASLLFVYRSALLVAGIIGCIMLLLYKDKRLRFFFGIIMIYFLTLYITMCFGNSYLFRNLEMRYFLPADILMLIPASYFIYKIIYYLKLKLG